MRRGIGRKLSSQIFVSNVTVLLAVVLVGFGLFARQEKRQLDQEWMDKSLAIAETVAGVPEIRQCIEFGAQIEGCHSTVQNIASDMQNRTHASYVVIVDAQQIRWSHPKAELVGQKITEPLVTKADVRFDNGDMKSSVNGRFPIFGRTADEQVGMVSVGMSMRDVTRSFYDQLWVYALWFGAALGIGAVAS